MFLSTKLDQLLEPSTEGFWPLHAAGENSKNRILQNFKIINKLVLLTIFVFIGGYVLMFLPLVGDEVNINAIEVISKHYFGRWSLLFSAIIYLHYPVFAIGLLYPFLLMAYLTTLAVIQLILLRGQIRMIAEECIDFQGNHLLSNECYQNAVYQKIVLCIEHHIRLKR